MTKAISFKEFTDDIVTYVDFVVDSGNVVVVNNGVNSGIVILPIEEYNSLTGTSSTSFTKQSD